MVDQAIDHGAWLDLPDEEHFFLDGMASEGGENNGDDMPKRHIGMVICGINGVSMVIYGEIWVELFHSFLGWVLML